MYYFSLTEFTWVDAADTKSETLNELVTCIAANEHVSHFHEDPWYTILHSKSNFKKIRRSSLVNFQRNYWVECAKYCVHTARTWWVPSYVSSLLQDYWRLQVVCNFFLMLNCLHELYFHDMPWSLTTVNRVEYQSISVTVHSCRQR